MYLSIFDTFPDCKFQFSIRAEICLVFKELPQNFPLPFFTFVQIPVGIFFHHPKVVDDLCLEMLQERIPGMLKIRPDFIVRL